ncbi:MAG: sensor histidine kinase, partial [Candidatus Kapaibacterium sp.]
EDYTEEMERYSAKLEEQAKVIEEKNTQLQSKNDELAIVNEQLEDYTEEMERYSAKLEAQAREITAASAQIHEQNAALQDLNTRKNELIGVVAHDLKNPLAAILMSSSLMLRYYDKMTKDDHLQNTQRIKETGERMNKIITDLLDIEAIESGKFKLTLEECDIAAIVNATVEDYHDAAERKQISILTESAPNLALGYADKHALRQILDNLVSNAVKYSPPERRIWVTTHEGASTQGAPTQGASMLLVDVRDEGPGLSAEDQTKLFGRFAKLTPQPTGGEHSTGLGLSIVKQLAEAMGGTVRCRSTVGVGTTFTVEIPKKG